MRNGLGPRLREAALGGQPVHRFRPKEPRRLGVPDDIAQGISFSPPTMQASSPAPGLAVDRGSTAE
jgi:hypothetical protein